MKEKLTNLKLNNNFANANTPTKIKLSKVQHSFPIYCHSNNRYSNFSKYYKTSTPYVNQNLFLFFFVILFITPIKAFEMTRNGCGDTKGCLFKPAGCDPQLDCTIGIIFFVSDSNKLTIQLVAHSLLPAPHYQYIAIGFSRDTVMGDDFVSECVLNPSGSAFSDVEVFASYNRGKSNDRVYLDSDELSILYDNIEGEVVNGRLMCQFEQQIVPQINTRNNKIWNLNDKFYIFGATGSAQPDEINVHDTSMGSHFYPITTTRPINPSMVGGKIYSLPPLYNDPTSTTPISNTVDDKNGEPNLEDNANKFNITVFKSTKNENNIENSTGKLFLTSHMSMVLMFMSIVFNLCQNFYSSLL